MEQSSRTIFGYAALWHVFVSFIIILHSHSPTWVVLWLDVMCALNTCVCVRECMPGCVTTALTEPVPAFIVSANILNAGSIGKHRFDYVFAICAGRRKKKERRMHATAAIYKFIMNAGENVRKTKEMWSEKAKTLIWMAVSVRFRLDRVPAMQQRCRFGPCILCM